jgi:hypothetical protein
LLGSQTGYTANHLDFYGDKHVPADYDGGGKSDVAVFRKMDGCFANRPFLRSH